MNTTRKDFLGLAGVFAAAGCASAPAIKPPRFKPIEIAGLEPKPDWWKCRPDEIIALCEGAKRCSRKEIICHTPLGYPVYALFYGDFSEPAPQTNWSAGQGSTTYRNYYGRAQGGKRRFLRIQRYIGRAAIIAHLRARHTGHAQQRLLHARLAVGAGHAADDQAFGRHAHCRPFFQLAKAALACLSAAAGMVMVSASVW